MAVTLAGLLFATGNEHKLLEARAIAAPLGLTLVSLVECGLVVPEPTEDGATFEENAALKARYYAKAAGRICLAEDSGLVVDALGGEPGVYSARYAGTEGSRAERDRANNQKLLRALGEVPEGRRAARFVCSACIAEPSGDVVCVAVGTMEGAILRAERGDGGFGYDPLLWLAEERCTSAELPATRKNLLSHRGKALRSIVAQWLAWSARAIG